MCESCFAYIHVCSKTEGTIEESPEYLIGKKTKIMETCPPLTAQDQYKDLLEYFKIE